MNQDKIIFKQGDLAEGIVTSIKKYGVFLSFSSYYSGLIHISDISNDFINDIRMLFEIGDKVLVYIKEVDEHTKFLKLSIKLLPDELNPYKEMLPIKKITSYLRDIDFSKLNKALPKLIKEELEREKDYI